MIFLADQPPRVNQLRFLTFLLLLALLLLPNDRILFFSDTPESDAAVYTLCTTARPVQAGSCPHSPLTSMADCAFFVSTRWVKPAFSADFDSLCRVLPAPQLVLRC